MVPPRGLGLWLVVGARASVRRARRCGRAQARVPRARDVAGCRRWGGGRAADLERTPGSVRYRKRVGVGRILCNSQRALTVSLRLEASRRVRGYAFLCRAFRAIFAYAHIVQVARRQIRIVTAAWHRRFQGYNYIYCWNMGGILSRRRRVWCTSGRAAHKYGDGTWHRENAQSTVMQ